MSQEDEAHKISTLIIVVLLTMVFFFILFPALFVSLPLTVIIIGAYLIVLAGYLYFNQPHVRKGFEETFEDVGVANEDTGDWLYPEWFLSSEQTDPNTLRWEPLLTSLRMRMNYTDRNVSPELHETMKSATYPDRQVPEIDGLLRALNEACRRTGINCRLAQGRRELQPGTVGYLEPVLIRLPFKKAELRLYIVPTEIQWILKGHRKEKPPLKRYMDIFKNELLNATREWLRRGNR